MVRLRDAKNTNDIGKQSLGSRTHVDGFDGKPYSVDSDHRSKSCNQRPHAMASVLGQLTTTDIVPRRNSIRISVDGLASSIRTGKNALLAETTDFVIGDLVALAALLTSPPA